MNDVNLLAVLIAAASSFLLGGLWYSPLLFGKAWNRAARLAPQRGHPAKVFGISFVFALVAAGTFAIWVGPNPPLWKSLGFGLMAGVGLVATSFGINYQFANRGTQLWLIDGGYHVAQFVLYGLILGLWH